MKTLILGTAAWAVCMAPALADDLWDDRGNGDGDDNQAGWYLGAGAGVQKLESYDPGYQGVLLIGYTLPYRNPDAPMSTISVESEFTRTFEPMERRRRGVVREAELTTGGVYLAANTHVSQRIFYRARIGGVLRYLERDDASNNLQARLGFGLGLGFKVLRNLDLVTDAGIEYFGASPLTFTGTVTARVHF